MTLIASSIVTLLGVGLALYGRSLPVFTVPYAQAEAAFIAWCTDTGVDDAAGDRYLALFGWHYSLINLGLSLASGGLAAGLLAGALRFTTRDPVAPWYRTPHHRLTFIAIGIGILVLCLPLLTNGLSTDLARMRFPPCADSIAIPIMGFTAFTILLTPILALIGFAITRGFGQLPVSLLYWDASRPRRSWAVTIVTAAAIGLGLVSAAASAITADIISPCAVLATYLLAATRAALLAPVPQSDPASSLPA